MTAGLLAGPRFTPCSRLLGLVFIAAAAASVSGCALFSGAPPESGAVIRGKASAVADGNSITVTDEHNKALKVRLNAVDAPDLKQAFGGKAREALSAKVLSREVKLVVASVESDDSILADVYVAGHWINKEMVAEGWAWYRMRCSHSQEMADAENLARRSRLGLWADENPIPPHALRDLNSFPKPTLSK